MTMTLKGLLCQLPTTQREAAGKRVLHAETKLGFTDIRFFDRIGLEPDDLHVDDLIGEDAKGRTNFLPTQSTQ